MNLGGFPGVHACRVLCVVLRPRRRSPSWVVRRAGDRPQPSCVVPRLQVAKCTLSQGCKIALARLQVPKSVAERSHEIRNVCFCDVARGQVYCVVRRGPLGTLGRCVLA